ncbi:MAB_1171c family putative transporter [Nocardia brasiliensis]|uniref:MAB_1171c family putative transporter n=1 Tax=Nocardia brasiliensis TaxID=37326 RepID=UPI00366B3218
MTPPVPIGPAALALVFALAVATARWFLVNETFGDRLVNRVLSWLTGAAAIQVFGAGTDFADLTYRLFLGCGVITLAYVSGIVTLFAGADADVARRRQPVYNTVAVLGAVIVMIIGRPADAMDPGFGWKAPLVWAIFNVPMASLGIYVIRACVREFRVPGAAAHERLVFSVLFLTSGYAIYAASSSGVQVLGGRPPDSPPEDWTTASCFSFFMITLLLSAPVVNAGLVRAGWDRSSRRCRQLWPLWRDLTAAVPAIVLAEEATRRDPELRLYRMLVEIRDALQHLKQYMTPGDHLPVTNYAAQVAQAAADKLRGIEPAAAITVRDQPITRDMAAELDHLLELARVWPGARG